MLFLIRAMKQKQKGKPMKTYKELVEGINETLSFLEDLDESNENFDSNSKAHQAAKKAVKGWRGVSKATYHSDGSATINTKDKTKNRYGKDGHYSGLETTKSHSAVDQHLKYAGGMHNHSRDELDNHHQKIGNQRIFYKIGYDFFHLESEKA
jgi:hypothetical protein